MCLEARAYYFPGISVGLIKNLTSSYKLCHRNESTWLSRFIFFYIIFKIFFFPLAQFETIRSILHMNGLISDDTDHYTCSLKLVSVSHMVNMPCRQIIQELGKFTLWQKGLRSDLSIANKQMCRQKNWIRNWVVEEIAGPNPWHRSQKSVNIKLQKFFWLLLSFFLVAVGLVLDFCCFFFFQFFLLLENLIK